MDDKQHSAALFISFLNVFDAVNHQVLLQRLHTIGLCEQTLHWFDNYQTNRPQSVQIGFKHPLVLLRGQCWGCFCLLSTVFSGSCKFHFYAYDNVFYCSGFSSNNGFNQLQSVFTVLQTNFHHLKLVLNAEKLKVQLFSNGRFERKGLPVIITNEHMKIENVPQYEY